MTSIARNKITMIALFAGLMAASAGAYPINQIATGSLWADQDAAIETSDVGFVDRVPAYIESKAASRGFREIDLDF
jgi:hypothetical protein